MIDARQPGPIGPDPTAMPAGANGPAWGGDVMFGTYGDESPEELRDIRIVNRIMVACVVAMLAILAAAVIATWPECRIPERCALQ